MNQALLRHAKRLFNRITWKQARLGGIPPDIEKQLQHEGGGASAETVHRETPLVDRTVIGPEKQMQASIPHLHSGQFSAENSANEKKTQTSSNLG